MRSAKQNQALLCMACTSLQRCGTDPYGLAYILRTSLFNLLAREQDDIGKRIKYDCETVAGLGA